MSVEDSLKEMTDVLNQVIGIVEDVKEIKSKLNNIERDISGYREEMIELRTNVKNFQSRFNEHRAHQEQELEKISCDKRKIYGAIDASKQEARQEAVQDVKIWLYGTFATAAAALLIPILKGLVK